MAGSSPRACRCGATCGAAAEPLTAEPGEASPRTAPTGTSGNSAGGIPASSLPVGDGRAPGSAVASARNSGGGKGSRGGWAAGLTPASSIRVSGVVHAEAAPSMTTGPRDDAAGAPACASAAVRVRLARGAPANSARPGAGGPGRTASPADRKGSGNLARFGAFTGGGIAAEPWPDPASPGTGSAEIPPAGTPGSPAPGGSAAARVLAPETAAAGAAVGRAKRARPAGWVVWKEDRGVGAAKAMPPPTGPPGRGPRPGTPGAVGVGRGGGRTMSGRTSPRRPRGRGCSTRSSSDRSAATR